MRTLILGIGNILWADEGFGVRAVEEFHARYETGADVTVLDGGTQGLYLVQFVEACDQLLVFDAIDYGLEPGTLRIVRDGEVPRFMGAKKMSLHQTGFQEVLSAADLLGRYPSRLALIGCQPQDLENWGGPLTAPVAAAVEPALAAAVDTLVEWGVELRPRAASAETFPRLLAHDLDHDAYERRLRGAEEETRP
ncbi:HyaD/HybD family hydrogenase maturation endopeptidase [Methylosinus sp. Ce-a6]|uniref:HyaD/HybD family hydrogenase maturation endopeptidase n=1 Tax=Methylosinus sp. Ce-a6 TaxID=2172005 RepID=UPI0013598C65|nr:HyaD/HybD family hydrogenase maturation endopeptidase [Methylosinus sp. Ce-a6]